MNSKEYRNYEEFRKQNQQIVHFLKNDEHIEKSFLEKFIQNNPDFWMVYDKVGDYYFQQKDYQQASFYFKLALTKEITTIPDRNKIQKKLAKCSRKTR